MPTTTCPSREMFLQYSLGLVSEGESILLADHLDSCPDCQDVVMTLDDADDTVVGRLRLPLSSESVLAEPQLHRALAAAIAMPMPNATCAADVECELTSDMPETLGEYQLLGELGCGGMGRVYKALHTKLDRVVTLKVLPRDRVGDRQAIARFEREMKAVARLDHPNIVHAYDAREINDMPVLIMEFVDGLDLADIVRRVGTVPVVEACELVRRTALALQCAHEHGLVHRDIKPSNIMLTPAGEVKLLDLGLARFYAEGVASVPPASARDEMTGTGQAMGTADYMAPEQASDSRTVDIRADLYSLGCTLYKLLSGRAPFSGPEYRSTLDKLNAHVHQPVPPIRTYAPEVPEELAAILDRMLAKDPGERFATPADVAAALEPFCQDANLADLIAQAMAIDEGSLSRRESASGVLVSQRKRASASPVSRRPIIRRILIGLGFFGAIVAAFAAGIVITIKMNEEKYQVKVPGNSRTDIDEQGNATVIVSGKQENGKASIRNAAAEAKALQGRWRVVRVEKGGNADSMMTGMVGFDGSHENPANAGYGWLTFEGGSLDILDYTRIEFSVYDYEIDPTPATKTINLVQDMGVPRAQIREPTILGIYEIDGDRLRLCLARRLPEVKLEQRPKQFAVDRNSGNILILLDRDHPSDDEKAIQGEWKVIGQTDDGKPASAEFLQSLTGSWSEIGFAISAPGMRDILFNGPCVLDAAKNPKTITIRAQIEVKSGQGSKTEWHEFFGIYKIENDRLQIAYRRDGPRPEKFESTPGSGVTLWVFERPKAHAGTDGMQAPPARVQAPSGGSLPGVSSAGASAPATPSVVVEPKAIQSEAATPFAFRTTTITRGDITATIGASGTIEPEEVVDVGAQVTGIVVSLGADPRGKSDPSFKDKTIDYGSPVEKDMILAKIDDALYKA
ncbi:MAG: TIGR03067 domain-containing protein, partial [Thermoguttaceae bacterium]